MNHAPDPPAPAGHGGSPGPRQAAALLDHATQQARRRLEPAQPRLLAIRAVLVLAVCGAIWLSVRGQHPYHGPTAAVLPVVLAFAAVNLGATLAVARRATAGISGRSRLRRAEIAVLAAAWIAPFAGMGALAGAGASRAVVYGLYPATVPLIAAGLAWAAIMAARASWRACGTGLAAAAAAAASAGPAAAWAVTGTGLCAVLLGSAAAITWQQRRTVTRP